MPALWPKFITDVSNYIANGDANAGGPGFLNALDRTGIDINTNFAVKQYIPFVTPSGRRTFGEALAEFYLDAISTAQTPFGATHQKSPAAQIFVKTYGEVFEQIFRNGEPMLFDQKDSDGNVITQGKESLDAYSEMSTEIPKPPTKAELDCEREKNFCQFLEDEYNNLYSFSYFEFHCIREGDNQSQIEDMFVNRILQQFEKLSEGNQRWEFYQWATSLGKEYYKNFNFNIVNLGSGFSAPYINVHNDVKNSITNAGYNWQTLIDNVARKFKIAVEAAHLVNASGTANDTIESAIKRTAVNPIQKPWPFESDRPEKELNTKRIQVSYNREEDSERPIILTDAVVAFFSYREDVKESLPSTFTTTLIDGTQLSLNKWQKDPDYVENTYVENEYKAHWIYTPEIDGVKNFNDIKLLNGGTLFEFTKWQGVKEGESVIACDAIEQDSEIPFDYSCYEDGKDPWTLLAQATIAYWFSTIVQPFKPTPSALPALSPAPLGGVYVPVCYGSVKRLANNLRKAMHMGKTFSDLPSTQPPAIAVASALAATYAIHLLEFKLIYLGGIPTPAGPVPMVGFIPFVF
jgi:hypothetical protein